MAIAFVQDGSGTTTVTLTGTGAGNLLIYGVNSASPATAVSDGVNTWVQAVNATSSGVKVSLWYAANIAGGNVTVVGSGISGSICWCAEFSGASITAPLSTVNSLNNQPSGPLMGPPLTDPIGNALLVAVPAGGTMNPTSVAAPWLPSALFSGLVVGAYYIPGTPVTNSQAVFNVTTTYASVGGVFVPASSNKSNMFLVF